MENTSHLNLSDEEKEVILRVWANCREDGEFLSSALFEYDKSGFADAYFKARLRETSPWLDRESRNLI